MGKRTVPDIPAEAHVEAASCSPTADSAGFCLLWTIGFSGKRFFPTGEKVIQDALKKAVDFFCAEAKKQGAQLTAISSLARGGDVLFAETVCQPNECGFSVQWKCLLPFDWDAFIHRDLANDGQELPLPAGEREAWINRAANCLRSSVPPAEVTSPSVDPADDEQREEAYLHCGYRTVDESDVMLLLMEQREIDALLDNEDIAPNEAGTFAVARYALAARRPILLLPADVPDPWQKKSFLNDPREQKPASSWFVDPMITDVVRRAKAIGLPCHRGPLPAGIASHCGKNVWEMRECLGHLADRHQGRTVAGLRRVLRFHLAASALAALMATVFISEELPAPAWLVALVLLAFMKPLLAFGAWWLERHLHHRGDRTDWIHARVLAELCRGALATWPLPIQPLDASDEEDFPKVKRLIRTLRLLREQDSSAAIRGTPPQVRETQLEADMRTACQNYVSDRLMHQAAHYSEQHFAARRQVARWRMGFVFATWVAIFAGLTLAVNRIFWARGDYLLVDTIEHWMEAVVIIAPFVAAHCLGMMTILDCRRRETRYDEMRHYLARLADTLAKTHANPSRIRIVEHAERMMIEEQHEWFSVMRNISV